MGNGLHRSPWPMISQRYLSFRRFMYITPLCRNYTSDLLRGARWFPALMSKTTKKQRSQSAEKFIDVFSCSPSHLLIRPWKTEALIPWCTQHCYNESRSHCEHIWCNYFWKVEGICIPFQQLSTTQILEFCSSYEHHCDRKHIKFFKVSHFSSQVSADYITISGKYLLTSFWLQRNQDFRPEC